MPTSPLMSLPKTKSAEEFESMCKHVLNAKYGLSFETYGRKGQRQCGIDIFAKHSSGLIVAQCKNYIQPKSTKRLIDTISEDITSITKRDDITKIVIMTAYDRDARVQDSIVTLCEKPVLVEVMFWEDIQEIICCNEKLLNKYYPLPTSNVESGQNLNGHDEMQKYFDYCLKNTEPILKKIRTLKTIHENKNSLNVKIKYNDEDKNLLEIIPILEPKTILFLLGNGGSGKTYAFLNAWNSIIDGRCSIFIRLHMLDSKTLSIQEAIKKFLFNNDVKKFNSFYHYWVEYTGNSPLLLFLDGFNEIPIDDQNEVWQEVHKIVRDLNVIILISSRYADNLKHRVNNVSRADMKELDKDAIRSFLINNDVDVSVMNNVSLLGLLKNPLMLSLYAQTAREYGNDCAGSIKFYGPVYSESTIIWNYYQHELMKGFEEATTSAEDKILSFIAVNFVLPYICYNMQKNGKPQERFNISSSKLKEEIGKAVEICSEDFANFERFKCLKTYLNYLKEINFNSEYCINRIKELSTVKLQLFCQLNFVNPSEHKEDKTLYSLFHQQLRDCLAGIYLLHGMEICGKNKILSELAFDNITCNQPMVRHVAFLEQRNGRANIDKQWELLRGLRFINRTDNKKVTPNLFINNLVAIYKYVTNGNFSELDFSNIDLRHVSLNGFSFQPVTDKKIFNNATFGTKTFTLGGHTGRICNLAACGNTLVSRDPDSIRIWNIDTSECVNLPFISEEYNDEVKGLGVDILPTNEHIILYSNSTYVIERNIENEDEKSFEGATANIYFVCYSPDGKYIMCYTENDDVFVWDRNDNKNVLFSVHCDGIAIPAISNSKIAYCINKSSVIFADFSTKNKATIPVQLYQNEIISAIAFMPDGQSVVLAIFNGDVETNENGTITLLQKAGSDLQFWKINEFVPYSYMKNCSDSLITSVKVHPYGEKIAFLSNDHTYRMYEVIDGEEPREIIGPTIYIKKQLENYLHEREIDTLNPFKCLNPEHSDNNSSMIYDHKREKTCCVSCGVEYDIFDIMGIDFNLKKKEDVYNKAYNVFNTKLYGGYTSSITFFDSISDSLSASERVQQERGLFVGFVSGEIFLYEILADVPYTCMMYTGHKPCVNCFSVAPHKSHLIGAYSDGSVREWSIEQRLLIHDYNEHRSSVRCVEFEPNGEFFASGHADGSICLWDTNKHTLICKLMDKGNNAHNETVRDLKFTNDGKLISCANDHTIKLWNIETQEVINTLKEHSHCVKCLLYYEDESCKIIISGSTDRSIIIWDVCDVKNCRVIEKIKKHKDRIRSFAMHKDKQTFVSNSEDGHVYEWKITKNERNIINIEKTGRELYVENESTPWGITKRSAEAIAYSADGEKLLIATDPYGANVEQIQAIIEEWDFTNKKQIKKMTVHSGSITAVSYHSDDQIISSSMDGNINIVNLYNEKTMNLSPSTSFSNKLEGYDLDTVKYVPEWIKGYYYGSTQISIPTVHAQNFSELTKILQKGILPNIFDFIPKNLSEKEAIVQINSIVDILLENTRGLGEIGDRAMRHREKTLLLACVYFAYSEAQSNEKTVLLICDLLAAAVDTQNREDDRAFSSDLDVVFKILKAKNPHHIALGFYDKHKNSYTKKKTILSCINRLYPLTAFYSANRKMLNRVKLNPQDVDCIVKSFIDNTKKYVLCQEDIAKAEQVFIEKIITHFVQSNQNWDKLDIMQYVCELINYINGKKVVNFHVSAVVDLFIKNNTQLVVEKSVASFISRLEFWMKFDERLPDEMKKRAFDFRLLIKNGST